MHNTKADAAHHLYRRTPDFDRNRSNVAGKSVCEAARGQTEAQNIFLGQNPDDTTLSWGTAAPPSGANPTKAGKKGL